MDTEIRDDLSPLSALRQRRLCLLLALLFIGATQLAAGHTHEDAVEETEHPDNCLACLVLNADAAEANSPPKVLYPPQLLHLCPAPSHRALISSYFYLARAPPSL